MSRLLFSSPAFVKLAEKSLSGARQVQDSSGEMCSSTDGSSSTLLRGVPVLVSDESPLLEAAVVTGLSSHDEDCSSLDDLGRRPTFNELPGDTLNSKSAAGGVINSPIIVPKPLFPPSDSDDDMIFAPNSFNHVSLVSDNSVDDEFNNSESLDTLLSSTSCSTVTTGTFQSSKLLPHNSGLGISGLTRKDGSGSFDGLGIVSIKSSAWRHDDHLPQSEMILQIGDGIVDQSGSIQEFNRRRPSSSSSSTYDGSEDFDPSLLVDTGDTGISDVFLQQTLLTFTQDPFHQLCDSIPDCDNNNSWSELELGLGLGDESTSTSTSMSELLANGINTHSAKDDSRSSSSSMMLNYRRRRIQKLNTNFSSATISSELKRSSTIVIPKKNWRLRSSSWPTSTMDGNVAATPLSRCKWRL